MRGWSCSICCSSRGSCTVGRVGCLRYPHTPSNQLCRYPLLEQLTQHPVRSDYKRPEDPDALPKADAVIVFPATFNTLNKWALGISDTLALGLLCELTGLGLPIVAVPSFRTGGGLDLHPAFKRSMRMLRRYGVHVLYEPEIYPPRNHVPAEMILETLHQVIRRKEEGKKGT